MRAAVVGAGPVGLVAAYALAERGDQVVLVDPDPGPAPDGTWRRHGVMQFEHPHFFRHQVREELPPSLWEAVVAAGGVANAAPEPFAPSMTTLACRRSTFEAALRQAVLAHPGVTGVTGRAEQVQESGGRVTGLVVDGEELGAERVVVAAGRTSRLGEQWRPEAEGGPCGQSYVSRMYRALPGAEVPSGWFPAGVLHQGYSVLVISQDAQTLSILLVRPASDAGLNALWRQDCFDTAMSMIPSLTPWTDPERFVPISDVMRGGTLTNTFRGQGSPPYGLFFVGDTVCTTNPNGARGTSLGLAQVRALMEALETPDASAEFDAWSSLHLRPWYVDHVARDASLLRRLLGEPVDPEAELTSDVIGAAAVQDPSLMPVVGPYLAMLALPQTLDAVKPAVREMLRGGWQPQPADGPSRDDLLAAFGDV